MASLIYGISGNGKRGIDYVKPNKSMFKPKPKGIVKNPKALYSHSTYGNIHNIYSSYIKPQG